MVVITAVLVVGYENHRVLPERSISHRVHHLRHERLSSLYVCRRMLVIFVLRSEQSEIGVDERHLGSGPRFGAPPAWAKNTVSGKKRSEERRVGKECGHRW